jgi:3-hydroxyisobutyrate dehydrogenase-like beta-hydroxyacid dehydrogenase
MIDVVAVAVIGLGSMGSRIAKRFVDAGHEVFVWNRTAPKMSPLIDLGAIPVESPAEAAHRAELVITMVSDPGALDTVTRGPAGLASGLDASTTLIEMSTVGPAAVSSLASALPNESRLLDAPVLGSLSEAEAGTLTIFVGGPDALVAECEPLLSTLGSPIHVGPLGAGAAAKLVANLTLFGTLGVVGEAVALARGLDLAPDAIFEVLSATPIAAQAARRRAGIETGEFPTRFRLSLARKDAELIMQAAAGSGVELKVGGAMAAWLAAADEAGSGDRDYAAVLRAIIGPRSA